MAGIREQTLEIGGLAFPVLAAGPVTGELVLLLHGFPQDGTAYADVLPRLAEGGFHAVAPTQRGYASGNRTASASGYTVSSLADDVLAMADELEADRFSLVGHDLGGLLTWHLAATRPDRVRTATVVSTPHPAAYRRSLLGSTQPLRSAYMPLFMMPVVPELLLGSAGGVILRAALQRSGLDPERAATYVERLVDGGALRSAFNWYRGLLWSPPLATPDVTVPTTYVWSDGDTALGRAAAEGTKRHVTGPYRFAVLEGVSHWVPEERPGELAELILDRLGA